LLDRPLNKRIHYRVWDHRWIVFRAVLASRFRFATGL